jgi:hypothetical protein
LFAIEQAVEKAAGLTLSQPVFDLRGMEEGWVFLTVWAM